MRNYRFRKYRYLQRTNKILTFLLLVIVVLAIFFVLYQYKTESKTNTIPAKTEHHILIATEQSYFKDSVAAILKRTYREEDIAVQRIDISALPEMDPDAYTAIIIIHSLQARSAPEEVKEFIEYTKTGQDKIIVMTTSSDGSYAPENVDAITAASKISDARRYANKILERTAVILDKNQ